jgi:endonuclease G
MNVSQTHSATGQSITYTIPLNVTVEIGMPMAGGRHQPGAGPTWGQVSSEYEDDDLVLTEARPEDYADRAGYDSDFIGQGFTVPLPDIVQGGSDVLTFEFEGETQNVLKYQHFSVLMSRSRRLCRYSAVNINGNEPRKAKRPGWRNDPRIPAAAQIAKECYGNPPKFSRGHMTRREDPLWGSQDMANRGNADSMHATNAVPQMQPFNAGIWLGLEDYALEHARQDDMRISVFTGPFLRDDDPVRYRVQIPLTFWKVIAFIHDDTGELCATGYYMSQEDYLREEEFVFGQHKTAQVPIAWIEEQSGLSFGELTSLDPMDLVQEGPPAQLMDFSQIRFVR